MSNAPRPFFEIRSTSIPTDALAQRIEGKIEERERTGGHAGLDMNVMTPIDLTGEKGEGQLIPFYLTSIQQAWPIDMNDFPIPRKPGFGGTVEWTLKKVLWKLLKFYTFRMFSQQREFNSQVSHAMGAIHKDYNAKLNDLRQQLRTLEEDASRRD